MVERNDLGAFTIFIFPPSKINQIDEAIHRLIVVIERRRRNQADSFAPSRRID
jgi:hypothetical protein